MLPDFLIQNNSRSSFTISQEFEKYLTSGRESNSFLQPLEWWKANSYVYPKLAKVARKVLAIPATSAASERIFSRARLVMPWNRSRLNPSTMRAIMCLRDWLNIIPCEVDEIDLDKLTL